MTEKSPMNTGINRLVQAVNFPLGLLGRGRAPLEADSSDDDEGRPQELLHQLDEIVHQHGQNSAATSRDTVAAASLLSSLTKTVNVREEEDDMEDDGDKKPAARRRTFTGGICCAISLYVQSLLAN